MHDIAHGSPELMVASEPGHPTQLGIPPGDLDSLCAWFECNREAVRGALDQYDALYLRGLPISGAADFGRVRDARSPNRRGYPTWQPTWHRS